MISPLTDSGVNKDPVNIPQPPLVAVAWGVRGDGVLNPIRWDDLFATPMAAIEVEVSKAGHIPGFEHQSPTPDAVPLGIPGPTPGRVSEHV